jgi:hypothetical protein
MAASRLNSETYGFKPHHHLTGGFHQNNSKGVMMRVATWNIYWLGERTGDKIQRSESDYKLIAQVIDRLSPDVLVLEEIVDPLVMEHILALASTEDRDYIIRTSDANWLTSDAKPLDALNDLQKVFLCINNKTVEFITAAAIKGGPQEVDDLTPQGYAIEHRVKSLWLWAYICDQAIRIFLISKMLASDARRLKP